MAAQRPGYGPPTPVEIFQWEAEFSELLALYKQRAPMRVLEVGTYHGGTLYHWLTNAAPGATVVTLDSYRVGVDNRHMYEDWCPDGVEVVTLEGDSGSEATAALVQEHAPFEWVWIDAGHYYPEVQRDWNTYCPMCVKGGIVAFHDILPPSPEHPEIEVAQLWNEIKAQGLPVHEIVADRSASWGGIGVVFV